MCNLSAFGYVDEQAASYASGASSRERVEVQLKTQNYCNHSITRFLTCCPLTTLFPTISYCPIGAFERAG